MFTLIRTALRSFLFGLALGILIAPRSGAATRRLIAEKVEAFINAVLEVGGLPPVRLEEAEETQRPTPMRARRAEDLGAATSA